jgi:hypothetical protein
LQGELHNSDKPLNSPLEEICVFGLSDQARAHHNGLETLPLDGP